MNFVFQEKWIELSPRYNFQISIFNMGFDEFFDPILVHFTDGRKPWHWETFDWNVKYLDAYKELAKNAKIPLGEFPKPSYRAKKNRRYTAIIISEAFFKWIGVMQIKQRRKLNKHILKRKRYIEFFEDSITKGRFHDMLHTKNFNYEECDFVFNGRIMNRITN